MNQIFKDTISFDKIDETTYKLKLKDNADIYDLIDEHVLKHITFKEDKFLIAVTNIHADIILDRLVSELFIDYITPYVENSIRNDKNFKIDTIYNIHITDNVLVDNNIITIGYANDGQHSGYSMNRT